MEQTEKKKHLDFIDFAKGLCILLIVSYHVDQGKFVYGNEEINSFFFSFRIPLYFILSGFFVSFTKGYLVFLKKKLNRLIVPLLFFYVLTCAYALCYELVYAFLQNGGAYKSVYDLSLWDFIYKENPDALFPNNPIWFLVSLFTTYMIYMACYAMTKGSVWKMFVLSLLFGVSGYLLASHKINLPLYVDSSLTCMPFVCIGLILRKFLHILDDMQKWKCLCISMLCFALTYIARQGLEIFYLNEYHSNIISLYVAGVAGACGIIYLSKLLNYNALINYIGRYSVIVLGTHYIFYQQTLFVFHRFHGIDVRLQVLISFVYTLLLSVFAIWFLKKYLPYFVAQKDIF